MPFISFQELCHKLLLIYVLVSRACVAAEMKVGVTHVGTLSVWLAWLRDAVMDISSELSTRASSVLTERLAGILCVWSAKSEE